MDLNISIIDYTNLSLNLNQLSVDDVRKKIRHTLLPETLAWIVLFFIGAIGNLLALNDLLRKRHLSSFVNYLMVHLTLSDLLVVFISMPIEIFWRLTITWEASDLACRLLQACKSFGLYLSSLIVICISIDRLNAFSNKSSTLNSVKRVKKLLLFAWILSIILSLPQVFIYSVQELKILPGYFQCLSHIVLNQPWKSGLYDTVCLIGMYFLPLTTIIFCYSKILIKLRSSSIPSNTEYNFKESFHKIRGNSNNFDGKYARSFVTNYHMYRDNVIQKARTRTIKMTLIIMVAFIICWSPYAIITLWEFLAPDSDTLIDTDLPQGLFIFVAANSCVNPFVYRMNLIKRFPQNLNRFNIK